MKPAMENKNKFRKSNRMLLDERPLVLLPSLAQAVGVNEAVVIQQLHFYLTNPDNGREHDGAQWIYKTYENWRTDDFPFLSTFQIQRIFLKLEERKLIVSCQPESRKSRRKHYRIDYERLEKFPARAHAHTRGTSQKRIIDDRKIARSSLSKTTRSKTTSDDDTRAHARTRETAAGQRANGKSSSSVWSSNLEEAQKDSLWLQFENYCLSNGGAPTLKGWNTWRPKQSANGAKPRLAAMRSKDLQSFRYKLIDERNSGKLSRAEMDSKREQLLEIKCILKTRGIEYAASL
jgi:hypothetical protein